jgi:uncharacterized protein (TIGR00269 family)
VARKCSFCGNKAIVYVGYTRKYYCREHFIEFIERKVERSINEFKMIRPGELVVAGISGGKDSATLATVLNRLRERVPFRLILAHIDLGIQEYSEKSRKAARDLSDILGLELIVLNVRELVGKSVPELARDLKRPACSVCGIVKRYLLNALAIELGADRIATGHVADDMAAYALKSFIMTDYSSLAKQVPVTETIEGMAVSRIKPLFTVYEKESFLYATLMKLPYYHRECPFARLTSMDFRLKELVNKLEDNFPGIKLQLVKGLARKASLLPKEEWVPVKCRFCGLISYGGECSFCKITRRAIGRPMGSEVRRIIRDIIAGNL